MLSYLAATVPDGTSPSARLLALQCALRVDSALHVRLPRGVTRGLGLDAPEPWLDLEQAYWLHIVASSASGGTTARLLDPALLGQAPARPDRRRAADWALRASRSLPWAAATPLERLAATCIAANTDASDSGWSEPGRLARACGLSLGELPILLDRLAAAGLVAAWRGCPYSEDLHWTLRAPFDP